MIELHITGISAILEPSTTASATAAFARLLDSTTDRTCSTDHWCDERVRGRCGAVARWWFGVGLEICRHNDYTEQIIPTKECTCNVCPSQISAGCYCKFGWHEKRLWSIICVAERLTWLCMHRHTKKNACKNRTNIANKVWLMALMIRFIVSPHPR